MGTDARTAVETEHQLLRHTLATLAYRGAKVVRGAPDGYSQYRAFETTRTPGQVLAHIGDLLDWALSMARGKQEWRDSPQQSWALDSQRFFTALSTLDAYLASGQRLESPAEKLFQGPIADAIAHVGQLAMLRRMAGAPVRGENYFRAEIVAGRVGPEQSPPSREFD